MRRVRPAGWTVIARLLRGGGGWESSAVSSAVTATGAVLDPETATPRVMMA